ncbi:XRN 5 -3 exonuclease [Babesia ovis]|uniref:5'-3' exoribonuclease n=1 Tax=Babesia ovis TaxID=5869 RepID=A0A9W5TD63_BABOV|nr:XRN 5 -3 exonuclease [Babesia ovis]
MGVPTFYRWLCSRYPQVVQDVKDDANEKGIDFDDVEQYGLDLLSPNPNGEFDNLYIDMNGLIHPCCHPEGLEQPPSEEVMYQCVFDYIDRLFYLIRPRKVLYLAIDGVAPRAKMNQQRSRRFKSAAEADLEDVTYNKVAEEFRKKNVNVPPKQARWDSNVITPGTPFMHELSQRVVGYIQQRRKLYEAWARIHVIYSDANVPGEGEHKIMNFIRNQRHSKEHDPNTRHVLHGMDADLIMLGLATHEVNFYIVREVVNVVHNRKLEDEIKQTIVNLTSHMDTKNKDMENNTSVESTNNGTGNISDVGTTENILKRDKSYRSMLRQHWKPLQFLRLPVLREYLSHQFHFPSGWNGKGSIDFERCIDDLVLMCFFCGNDFLPHLPSISIHSGSIDQMILLYQNVLPELGDYLTNEGEINLEQLGTFVSYIAKIEDQVFKVEQDFKHKQKMRRLNNTENNHTGTNSTGNTSTSNMVSTSNMSTSTKMENHRITTSGIGTNSGHGNLGTGPGTSPVDINTEYAVELEFKKRCDELIKQQREIDDPVEPIDLSLNDPMLWKDAYYRQKFGLGTEQDVWEFAAEVARHYIKGMCWVLKYYYQGCASWGWYYPFHYAPFCSDLKFDKLEFSFDYGKPFTPFQQLMSVMPIRSAHCLPQQLRHLMVDDTSPIAGFYPTKFNEDPNGKRYKYQWVALLPFIDEHKLLELVKPIEDLLPPELQERNQVKRDMLFASPKGKPVLVGETTTHSGVVEFVSKSGEKHRSCLLQGAKVGSGILRIQDLMEDGRTRGFNCETAKRMITNVLAGRGHSQHGYNRSGNRTNHGGDYSGAARHDNHVLRNTARDFHQAQNQYSTQQLPSGYNQHGYNNRGNRTNHGGDYHGHSQHGYNNRGNRTNHTNDYHGHSQHGYNNRGNRTNHGGDYSGAGRYNQPHRDYQKNTFDRTKSFQGASSNPKPNYMAGHKLERPPPQHGTTRHNLGQQNQAVDLLRPPKRARDGPKHHTNSRE